jgi:hypothetical protein
MIEIKHRFTSAVPWSGEAETTRDAVIAAVKARANLAVEALIRNARLRTGD